MDIKNTNTKVVGNHTQAMKHMGQLSLKIETITDQVEKMILEHKKININSQAISAEEASYNRGAVDALQKVLENLKKDCKEFS
jgi:ubiquinone biosynthesis protein UbiJ|tara:strand:+ start:27557 stop:27805 length:249 start_codon:yes stop_codon:yes gene_type:complete